MTRWWVFGAPIISLAMIGCTFHSHQLESLKAMLQPPQEFGTDFQWQVSVDGGTHQVYAIDNGNETLFSQVDVGLVRFDGWSISHVSGFGLPQLVTVETTPGKRIYKVGSAKHVHVCAHWQRQGLIWVQACESPQKYNNTIHLNTLGHIIRIDQVYDGNHRLILEKL